MAFKTRIKPLKTQRDYISTVPVQLLWAIRLELPEIILKNVEFCKWAVRLVESGHNQIGSGIEIWYPYLSDVVPSGSVLVPFPVTSTLMHAISKDSSAP
jgi:hypothetical protein